MLGLRSLVVAVVSLAMLPAFAMAETFRVYFGTYTGKDSRGIYAATFDADTGKLGEPQLVAEMVNPSFLAIHPSKKFLYAVGEIADFQGKKTGGISAFAIDSASGKLTLLNQQSSEGTGPCHVVVDKTGKSVLVANYGGGSCASLPIDADGKLGKAASAMQHTGSSVDKSRQEAPHAHSINLNSANNLAYCADLGLDKILIYKFDAATSKLTPNDPPAGVVAPGGGPRHFSFHPSGKFAYVCNEMTSTITAFSVNADNGGLTELHTLSTLPQPTPGNSTAEIVVHPSGKFVYVSNRGHDSLAMYSIDQTTGKLTSLGNAPTGGKTPRNFNIDPTGKWVLAGNQSTSNVTIHAVDQSTGKLTPTGQSVAVGAPVCVRFVALP
jgi:6-phosphogluconolactonase